MFLNYFRGIWRDRYILINLIRNDLRMKYRRSKLGILWSVLTPLGLALIIGSVYSIVFNDDIRTFVPLIFAGLNPWLFLSNSADGGAVALIAAEGYLKQTNVNAQIFPLRATLVNFINLLYALAAFLFLYLFLQPTKFGWNMLMAIPGLLILLVFTAGMANISAVCHLNLRDYQPMQALVMQGMFYATPIIFPAERLADQGYELVYELNPFYYMLEIIKQPIQGNPIPPLNVYVIAFAIAIGLFVISIIVVMKAKKGVAFKL